MVSLIGILIFWSRHIVSWNEVEVNILKITSPHNNLYRDAGVCSYAFF